MPYNYLLKKKYYYIKNLLRIFIIKNTVTFLSFFIMLIVGFYLLFTSLMDNFSNLHFREHIYFIDMLPFLGKSLVIIAAIMAYFILYFSYKSSLEEWMLLQYTPLSCKQVYFFSVGFYTIIVLAIILLLFVFVLLLMQASFSFIIQMVYTLFTLCLGLILFPIALFCILKTKYQNQLIYQILSLIIIILFSFPILLYLRTKDYQITTLYILINIPLIFGVIVNYIFRKRQFMINSSTVLRFSRECHSYKITYVIQSILKIEVLRNKKYLIELSIIPFACKFISDLCNFPINESILFILLALSSTFFIGISNSYETIYKYFPINQFFLFIARIVCGLTWGMLEYSLFSFIYPSLFSIKNIILFITWILFLMLLANVLKIPMIKNGKEHVVFYQLISLIASIYLLFINIVHTFLIENWKPIPQLQLITNFILVFVLACISIANDSNIQL